jgi:microsomal dipeptidase-like Zn-dependent dipeptidase
MEFMAPNRLIDAVDIMVRRNFSSEDITGILGGNFLALAKRVWL